MSFQLGQVEKPTANVVRMFFLPVVRRNLKTYRAKSSNTEDGDDGVMGEDERMIMGDGSHGGGGSGGGRSIMPNGSHIVRRH